MFEKKKERRIDVYSSNKKSNWDDSCLGEVGNFKKKEYYSKSFGA